MTLYRGKEKIAPIINIATTVRNQDKTVTENGTVTFDDGYTGLGTVTVTTHVTDVRDLTLDITENKTTVVEAPTDYDGYSKVTVTTNIPLNEKTYKIKQSDLDSNTIEITPDAGITGMTKVTIDLSEIVTLLSQI